MRLAYELKSFVLMWSASKAALLTVLENLRLVALQDSWR
jgi:hypothetical protein